MQLYTFASWKNTKITHPPVIYGNAFRILYVCHRDILASPPGTPLKPIPPLYIDAHLRKTWRHRDGATHCTCSLDGVFPDLFTAYGVLRLFRMGRKPRQTCSSTWKDFPFHRNYQACSYWRTRPKEEGICIEKIQPNKPVADNLT